jgi:hypothetical protein
MNICSVYRPRRRHLTPHFRALAHGLRSLPLRRNRVYSSWLLSSGLSKSSPPITSMTSQSLAPGQRDSRQLCLVLPRDLILLYLMDSAQADKPEAARESRTISAFPRVSQVRSRIAPAGSFTTLYAGHGLAAVVALRIVALRSRLPHIVSRPSRSSSRGLRAVQIHA